MHLAAIHGCEPCAHILIKAGADVNTKNSMDWTALHFAAMFNKPSLVKLIIENRGDKNLIDNRGMTALQHAENNGFKEIEELLKD